MVAVDTNILVRLLTRDDPAQYRASHRLFASEPIFIADTVILETEWVLRAAYDLTPIEVCASLRRLLGLEQVSVSNAQLLAQVINWHAAGLDFADAFHLALSQSKQSLKTFDSGFIKRAKALTQCLVETP